MDSASNTEVIIKALGRDPDISITFPNSGMVLTRWRHFLEQYEHGILANPAYCVHLSGKPKLRHWDNGAWTGKFSAPGFASLIPSGRPLRVWVDGELDVAALALPGQDKAPGGFAINSVTFGFSDSLGVMLTRQILSEAYADGPQHSEYTLALMTALEAHVLKRVVQPAASTRGIPMAGFSAQRIYMVADHINARPELEHCLETLAAMAGVTPSHFCRIFKQSMGYAPRQYVNKVRVDRARSILESTDIPISTIATTLGFNNQCHFNRLFREATGVTPGECRAHRKTSVH